jgi:hypothetical protein
LVSPAAKPFISASVREEEMLTLFAASTTQLNKRTKVPPPLYGIVASIG